MGDLSGYSLTIVAQETAPPYFVTPTVITDDASAVQIDPTACGLIKFIIFFYLKGVS